VIRCPGHCIIATAWSDVTSWALNRLREPNWCQHQHQALGPSVLEKLLSWHTSNLHSHSFLSYPYQPRHWLTSLQSAAMGTKIDPFNGNLFMGSLTTYPFITTYTKSHQPLFNFFWKICMSQNLFHKNKSASTSTNTFYPPATALVLTLNFPLSLPLTHPLLSPWSSPCSSYTFSNSSTNHVGYLQAKSSYW
jgi:hypothetical protein